MRQVAIPTLALALALSATACGGGDGGGSEIDVPTTDTVADTSGGDTGVEDTDEGDTGADTAPDTADDTGGDTADTALDTALEVDTTPPPDCSSDLDCKGKVTVGECEEAWCDAGTCAVREDPLCCGNVVDCVGKLVPTLCQALGCVQGKCVLQDLDNCCVTDSDCAEGIDGCCTIAECLDDNTCDVTIYDNCCGVSADCDDGNPTTEDACLAACTENGCINKAPVCEVNKVYTQKGFDDGTLQALTLTDLDKTDTVTATPTQATAATGKWSVYFGDPACQTYYTGPLTDDCTPVDPFAAASEPVSVLLKTGEVTLDAEAGAYLGFWLNMAAEPAFEFSQGGQIKVQAVDFLEVSVNDGTASEVVYVSTDPNALGKANTTGGAWVYQAANLSPWAGKTITLTFKFQADANANWNAAPGGERWFGAYVDGIAVRATCANAFCTGKGGPCPDDTNACTANTCTPYAGGSGGVCAFQKAEPGVDCKACSQPGDCGSDPCFTYACNAGVCSSSLKASCCAPSTTFPVVTAADQIVTEGFEDGALDGWNVVDPFPGDTVTWTLTQLLPYQGLYSLYFGDPLTQTYDGPNPAEATVWTPALEIDDDPFRTQVASFWLWLSTEYDGAINPPGPGEAFDVLTIEVKPVGAKQGVVVWNSAADIGGSTQGVWQQIGVDLSEWAGLEVQLGFTFDSFDTTGNDHGGVRIDELFVGAICGGADPCITATDCDDGDACTQNWCELGTCKSKQDDPLCCTAASDCDDKNACTFNTCESGTCVYTYDESKLGSCCSEGPWVDVWSAGFEDGPDGFTTETDTAPVVWRVTDERAANGSYSFTFSDPATGTFASGDLAKKSVGRLISKPMTVPPFTLGRPYAQFWFLMETEWDEADQEQFNELFIIDELRVKVKVDGVLTKPKTEWISHFTVNTTEGKWLQTRVDLGDYRGETVQLIFEFDSGDGSKNTYAGPFVDDVTFRTTCTAAGAIQCVYSGDCTPADACKNAVCTDEFKCVQVPKDSPECCEPYVEPSKTISFEGASTGWTFETCTPGGAPADPTVSWKFATVGQAANLNPQNGTQLLYFGNGVDFGGAAEGASCGVATGPGVTLDPGVPWSLEFWLFMDIEKTPDCSGGGASFTDVLDVEVIDAETGVATLIWSKLDAACTEYGLWTKQVVNLDAFAGKTIRFRFSFDSWDAFANSGKGVAIDWLRFTKGCAGDLP